MKKFTLKIISLVLVFSYFAITFTSLNNRYQNIYVPYKIGSFEPKSKTSNTQPKQVLIQRRHVPLSQKINIPDIHGLAVCCDFPVVNSDFSILNEFSESQHEADLNTSLARSPPLL